MELNRPQDSKNSASEVETARLDYAWKWFSFHAEQRTKMFNYMLIGLGVLATAVISALNDGLFLEAAIGSIAAALVGFAFVLLDRRNQQLYRPAMHLLIGLERNRLFREEERATGAVDGHWGIASQIKLDDDAHNSRSEQIWQGRHRILMPTVAWIFIALFVVVLVRSTVNVFSKSQVTIYHCTLADSGDTTGEKANVPNATNAAPQAHDSGQLIVNCNMSK
jgi:hypothetical protein